MPSEAQRRCHLDVGRAVAGKRVAARAQREIVAGDEHAAEHERDDDDAPLACAAQRLAQRVHYRGTSAAAHTIATAANAAQLARSLRLNTIGSWCICPRPVISQIRPSQYHIAGHISHKRA